MRDETPAISVIIPALNAERTLGAQLEALARQHVTAPWEVLLCDNGSTDGTVKLVEAWRERLPELVLIDASARRGPGAARNIGASHARSPLLLFCDADDVVADDWLREMHAALRTVDVVVGAGETDLLNSNNRSRVSWDVNMQIAKPYWPQYLAGGGGNLGVATSVFRAVGGFDESLRTGEDIDLCWRIQLTGHVLKRSESAVVHIRKHSGLRSIFRQAYSYSLGDRQLAHKYSVFIDAYWRSQPEEARVDAGHTALFSGPINIRGIVHHALRLLRRQGRANAAWRLGSVLGARTKSVDFRDSPICELAP
ncbi:MAG TPA: glycosyltransferase [Galbitalea sp.]|jgi:glycosyltransferase involved in cell wall biosynthesis